MIGVLYRLATVALAGAPSQEVDMNPTSSGAPGATTIQSLLDWLGQYALWGCLAAILAGGGIYAWGRNRGSAGMAVTGTGLAAGGGVGTLLVGLGPTIVNSLYDIT